MTPIDRFERQLPDELSYLAAERIPDYLDDLFAQTARTRQRPAWTFPERWLPMTIAVRRPLLAPPMRLLAVGLALLLALLGAMALAPILSSPRVLPATLATTLANGSVAFGRDGDIWVAEPALDGEARVIVGGPDDHDTPDWSPDGRSVAFWRQGGLGYTLMVAGADGTDVRAITTEPVRNWSFWWSPDSTQLVITSLIDGQHAVSLVATDGSGMTTLDLPFPADGAYFHPDGSSLLVRGRLPDGAGLYRVSLPDLTVSEPIIASDPESALYASYRGAYDFQQAIYSADGSHITFTSGIDNGDGNVGVFGGVDTRNFVMNADGSDVRMVEFDPASDYEDGPSFSPDGKRLAMTIRKGDQHQAAVVTLDGSADAVSTTARDDVDAMPVIWSPDGTQLLSVRIADGEANLIDPATGAETKLPWLGGWADWQPIPG